MKSSIKIFYVKMLRFIFAYFSKFFIKLMNIYVKSQAK